jgi:hypothetical protein
MAKHVPPPTPEPRGIGQGVWVAACIAILIFAAVMAVVVPSFTAKIKQMTETIEPRSTSRTAYVAPSVLPAAPVGRVHATVQKVGPGYFAVTIPDTLWYCMYVRKEGERGWRDVPQLSAPDVTQFVNRGGYFSFVVNTPVTIKYYKHADGPMKCFP